MDAEMSHDPAADLKMDPAELYLEETFTDNKVGAIRRLTPVDRDGETDPSRPMLFVGQAQLLTPMGAIPLSFQIEADTLGDAVDKFAAAAERQLEETARQIEEARREAASQIVIPKGGQGFGGPGGMPGGGLPGGGLKLP
jgi:hypothetical protein